MRLGGSTEVAAELGVSPQRISVLRQRPDFPDFITEIAQGPIWDLDVIKEWGGSGLRQKSAGRPKADPGSRTLGGRFVLELPPVGHGGFADVYRATDKKSGGTVAVKVLRDVDSLDSEAVARFKRELRIMHGFEHDKVISIIAHDETDSGEVWYAMPLAQGSLADFVTEIDGDTTVIAGVMRQVGIGLAHIHEQGIFHRDLKPGNVLRLEAEDWAISDFGLAVQVERDTDPLTSTTRAGLGSWVYTAPEQWSNARSADAVSDIYSMGKILQELVTGELPISADVPPGPLRPVIEKAIAQNPKNRYQTVEEFIEAMDRALGKGTQLKVWESREDEANRFAEKLINHPTADDLVEVFDWASSLDENTDEDITALGLVLPRATNEAISFMWTRDPAAFTRLIQRFSDHISSGAGFGFDYCDTIANFFKRVVSITRDPKILGLAVRALAVLGEAHNRWHVRDVLIAILQDVKAPDAAAEAVEALRSLDKGTVQWNITDFTIRTLAPAIRAGIGDWIVEGS
jgi:serine/threonine protein kinase